MRTVPDWDEYFLSIAKVVATRSKDSQTQVGTVIVAPDRRIVSVGYNGMLPGFEESEAIWEASTKYAFVVHSEANAITHAGRSLKGATLYCTHYACSECAKLIVNSGITKLIYLDNKHENEVSKKLLQNIEVIKFGV